MDAKVMIQELAKALATQNSINPKEAAEFVQTFFQVIIRVLKQDKYVKIKGLGTFKQIEVESRESMNIHTGERFEIQGHMKISFTPDTALRDTVNKPFAHFETVALNDDVTDLELEAVDHKFEEPEEVGQGTAAEMEISENTPDKTIMETLTEALIETSDEILTETPDEKTALLTESTTVLAENSMATMESFVEESANEKLEKEPEISKEPLQDNPFIDSISEPVSEVKGNPVSQNAVQDSSLQSSNKNEFNTENLGYDFYDDEEEADEYVWNRKKCYVFLTVVLVIVALAAGCLIGYLIESSKQPKEVQVLLYDTIYMEKKIPVLDSLGFADEPLIQKDLTTPPINETPASATSEPVVTKPAASAKTTSNKSTAIVKPTATAAQANEDTHSQYPQLSGGAYWITGTAQTYKLKKGETIRIIAERFFGSRQMELYIEKYNNISDPDHVTEGTVLNIPKLQKK